MKKFSWSLVESLFNNYVRSENESLCGLLRINEKMLDKYLEMYDVEFCNGTYLKENFIVECKVSIEDSSCIYKYLMFIEEDRILLKEIDDCEVYEIKVSSN